MTGAKMNDRTLLELAAKAAGIEPFDWESFPLLMIGDGPNYWNPLVDDGDALRLAARLALNPRPCALDGTAECNGHYVIHHHGEVMDVCSATRITIVLAAAEIGNKINEN